MADRAGGGQPRGRFAIGEEVSQVDQHIRAVQSRQRRRARRAEINRDVALPAPRGFELDVTDSPLERVGFVRFDGFKRFRKGGLTGTALLAGSQESPECVNELW